MKLIVGLFLVLLVLYASLLVGLLFPAVQRSLLYLNWVRLSSVRSYRNPSDFGLLGRNVVFCAFELTKNR